MAELLFIATTVFVAYVLFTVIGNDKENPDATTQPEAAKPDIAEKVSAPTVEKSSPSPKPVSTPTSAPVTAAKPVKPAKKSTASKAKPAPAPEKVDTAKAKSDSLKNPKTGEVAKVPANYAFAKRWIKEALVEEGLLDKIYKNNELDTNTVTKIQAALDQLKVMDKYQ